MEEETKVFWYCLIVKKITIYTQFKFILKLVVKQADNFNQIRADQLSVRSSDCLSYTLQFHNTCILYLVLVSQHFKHLLAPF